MDSGYIVLYLLLATFAVGGMALGLNKWQQHKRILILRKVHSWSPANDSPLKGRKVLIFVNPYSGARMGSWIQSFIMAPMLKKAGIIPEIIITKHSLHARQVCSAINPADYAAIVSVSGDGMMHQVINGLVTPYLKSHGPSHEKENIADVLREITSKTPLAVIPAGTSNGIVANFGIFDAFEGTKRLIEGKVNSLDIMEIIQPDTGKRWFDIHAISWGITSDYSALVEHKLRWMYNMRTLYAPLHVIGVNPRYKARLAFIPATVSEDDIKQHNYSDPSKLPEYEPDMREADSSQTWKVIQEDMTMLVAMNLAFASHDTIFCPGVKPTEGAIDIILIRKASRLQLLRTFIGLEDGSQVKQSHVETYKVKSFILEPLEPSLMDVSGEPIPSHKIVVKVHQSYCKFIH